jgi:hypothetical protein
MRRRFSRHPGLLLKLRQGVPKGIFGEFRYVQIRHSRQRLHENFLLRGVSGKQSPPHGQQIQPPSLCVQYVKVYLAYGAHADSKLLQLFLQSIIVPANSTSQRTS